MLLKAYLASSWLLWLCSLLSVCSIGSRSFTCMQYTSYKLHDAVAAPLQSPGGTIKIAPKELGFNMQFAVVEFGIGGVRDLHW